MMRPKKMIIVVCLMLLFLQIMPMVSSDKALSEIERFTVGVSGTSSYLSTKVRVPEIAVFPNQDIWVVFEGRAGGDYAEINLIKTISTDNGQIWSTPQTWYDTITEVQDGEDAVSIMYPGFLRDGNRMYFSFTVLPDYTDGVDDPSYFFLTWSDDNGSSWNSLLNLSSLLPTWADTGCCALMPGGICTSEGLLMLPCRGYNSTDANHYGFTLYSTSGSHENLGDWSAGGAIGKNENSHICEHSYCLLDDGRVMMMGRTGSGDFGTSPNISYTSNYGQTWSSLSDWVYNVQNCQTDVQTFSSTVLSDAYSSGSSVYNDRSRLLFSYVNDTNRPGPLYVAVSYDDGDQWDISKQISVDDNNCYSNIAVNDEGDIFVVYEKMTGTTTFYAINVAVFNIDYLTSNNDWIGYPLYNDLVTSSDEKVVLQSGNNNYTINDLNGFDSIIINESWISFNNTDFNITSTNPVNITLSYLNSNVADAEDDDSILCFTANTSAGLVWFNLSGFKPYKSYTIYRDGSKLLRVYADINGNINFSSSLWSEHDFDIKNNQITSVIVNFDSGGTDIISTGETTLNLLLITIMIGAILLIIGLVYKYMER